ncbi:hypothetical protein ISS07_01510 [Candidatus Woesearchaeota archaeon]|nr:hypothetical protein [Candidatus Woesearchaeota archaeon]
MFSKNSENTEKNLVLSRRKLQKNTYFSRIKPKYEELKKKYPDPSLIFQKKELFLPDFIFSKKLSALEAISKYLIEDCSLSIKEASLVLGKTNKNVWYAYNQSKKKQIIFKKKPKFFIPSYILRNENLSVLENLVKYLKEELNLKYSEIARILERDQRTIWTTYKKAETKQQEKNYVDISKIYINFHTLLSKFPLVSIISELEDSYFIPADIFSEDLSTTKSVVKFLKENYSLSISKISSLLKKEYASIWNSYSSSKASKLEFSSDKLIPVSALKPHLGMSSSIILFLKDSLNISYHDIALLMQRDERTVWTTYKNAKEKDE